MNIAYITNFFPPVQTGTAHYVMELADEMAKRGHTVIVLTVSPSGKFAEENLGGIHVYRLPSIKLKTSKLLLAFDGFYCTKNVLVRKMVIDILRENKIGMVHQCGHLLDLVFLTPSVTKRLGIPAICSIHTVIHHPSSKLLNAVLCFLDRLVIGPFAVNRYSLLLGLDEVSCTYIGKRYGSDNISRIPYGVDLESIKNYSNETVPDAARSTEEVFRITSIGHVTKMRSREDLILACNDLIREGLAIKLDIVGQICDTNPVRLVKKLGLEKHITFQGELPRELLYRFLTSSDLEAHWLTVPGLGTAILEAMALGVPCMTYGSEGILGDIPLRDRGNILFVTPNDLSSIKTAIRLLYFDPGLKERIAKNGRELILNHLAWAKLADRYELLYSQVLERSP